MMVSQAHVPWLLVKHMLDCTQIRVSIPCPQMLRLLLRAAQASCSDALCAHCNVTTQSDFHIRFQCYSIRIIPETFRNRFGTVPETVGIHTVTVETVDNLLEEYTLLIFLMKYQRFLRLLCEYQQFLALETDMEI